MFLSEIHFRNWKAYSDTMFDFEEPNSRKNVVLINAKNGYGKTSFFEALVLGMFGRQGLPLIDRASNEDGKLEYSYIHFVERALHARALEQGLTSASITLVFKEPSKSNQIKLRRVWHFSGSGKYKEEEVIIWVGEDEEVLSVPPLEEDREEFYRSYIAQNFLPWDLAKFFLFDGEQVQKLAKQDMASQVKLGIEGILGVPILRELAVDLKEYAAKRQKGMKTGNDGIDRLREEIRRLDDEDERARKELEEVTAKLNPLRSIVDQLTSELSGLLGSSQSTLKEEYELKGKLEQERVKAFAQLEDLLKGKISLALVGCALRSNAHKQLKAELIRRNWEIGKEQGEGKLEKFKGLLKDASPSFSPLLTSEQEACLNKKLGDSWEKLWYPPPAGCAEEMRHLYLSDIERDQVINVLGNVDAFAIKEVGGLLETKSELDRRISDSSTRIAKLSGIDERLEELAQKQKDANSECQDFEIRKKELDRAREGLKGQLNAKRQELGKLEQQFNIDEPELKKSMKADKIAVMIDNIIENAFPLHVQELAEEMTSAYKKMAHKSIVKSIEIDKDCNVRLLGRNGKDIRRLDASAGESQIFALSLIAAIAKVSKLNFPIVMDTPLARLDPDHRERVLKYFTEAKNQIIFLSQPAEITDRYYNIIKSRVSSVYQIEHQDVTTEVGISKAVRLSDYSEAAA